MAENHIFRKIRKNSQAQKLADLLSSQAGEARVRTVSTAQGMADAGMGMKLTCSSCQDVRVIPSSELVDRFGAECELKKMTAPCDACASTAVYAIPV